jgi:transcriptional regulator with XRE-family HTH domain
MTNSMSKRNHASRGPLLKQLGHKIMKDLTARRMSVDALALEVGVARSTLREIAAGRSNPRVLTLLAIAQGLGYQDLRAFFREL